MSLPNTKDKYFYELKCQMCNYIPRVLEGCVIMQRMCKCVKWRYLN